MGSSDGFLRELETACQRYTSKRGAKSIMKGGVSCSNKLITVHLVTKGKLMLFIFNGGAVKLNQLGRSTEFNVFPPANIHFNIFTYANMLMFSIGEY